jgi:hypothetical protein
MLTLAAAHRCLLGRDDIEAGLVDHRPSEDLKKHDKTDEKAGDVKEFFDDVKGKADDLVDDVKHKITKH